MSAPLQKVARLSQINEKAATLELAERFVSGCGVERNLDTARDLFRASARNIGGRTTGIYSSGEDGARLSVTTLETVVMVRGRPEGARRLAQLRMGDTNGHPLTRWPGGVCEMTDVGHDMGGE